MNAERLQGALVRLALFDFEKDLPEWVRWGRDSEYLRLSDSSPARQWPLEDTKKYIEDNLETMHLFSIRTLAEDRMIGAVDLSGFNWVTGNAWVGIGIGDRDFWGRGYGGEAMRLMVRYGFEALNLRRISLSVFEYNPRAIRSYEKAGFVIEGRARQYLQREGRRWDVIYMGILREDWQDLEKEGS